MKIILCLQHFLPEFIGGTEIYTLNLAKYLIKKSIEVIIVIPNLGVDLTTEYIYEGVRIIKYAEDSIEDRKMIMGKTEPKGLPGFVAIIKREAPDMIHIHEIAPGRGIGMFHVRKAHELDIPIVLTFHLSYYSCFKGSLRYKDEKNCDGTIQIERCTKCVYHSKNIMGIKEKLLSKAALSLYNWHINTTSLNNPVGTALGFPFVIRKIKKDLLQLSAFAKKIIVLSEWYKTVLENNEIPSEKLVFIKQGLAIDDTQSSKHSSVSLPLKLVFIGRICQLKGVGLLIDVVCSLPEEKVSLHIYGPETEEQFVSACKKRAAGKKNIYWHGNIPSSSVIATLTKYDILCLPSAFEMSSLVIQEAFAAGLPVLASDVYGNAEQVKEGINGWLFRFNDGKSLADKLNFLIENLAEVEKAKAHLPDINTFEEVAQKHFELYSGILKVKNLHEAIVH